MKPPATDDTCIPHGRKKNRYLLNEKLLQDIGFIKTDFAKKRRENVFRYYHPGSMEKGFDLIYSDDYSIVSVEEFTINPATGITRFRNTIVGMFHIQSDEDLRFIFSKNVRLNFVLNVSPRRVY